MTLKVFLELECLFERRHLKGEKGNGGRGPNNEFGIG